MCRRWSPLLALLLWSFAGCRPEKAPPQVQWLHPTSSPQWSAGTSVPLRFTFSDPGPERGRTTPAEWRIEIGPEAGGVWWSASGTASAAPEAGSAPHRDTVDIQWQVPLPPVQMSGPAPMLLSAIVTDGEGGRGADFTSAAIATIPLESSGLWYLDGGSGESVRFLPTSPASPEHSITVTCGPIRDLVHLDGEGLILAGGATTMEAWPTGIPAPPEPSWTIEAPLSGQTGGLGFLRRAPSGWATDASALVGWPDRVQWLDAQGQIGKTWTMTEEETLLDAAVMDDRMIMLARTSSGELRLIRCNVDNGARIASITWTPEASGSTGPEGRAWLIALDGDPAGLEADGTARRWYAEPGGNTGLSTEPTPGTGGVTGGGILTEGTVWTSRDQAHLFHATPLPLGQPVLSIEEDRAGGLLWVMLVNPGSGEGQWTAMNSETATIVGTPLPAWTGTTAVASVAHNRPGPP